MEDLISVIIPVYNAQKYLRRCLNSVKNQTYKNLEIILVDDGSTDRSPRICDEYARKDRRFKVIHKSNGGVSSARNVGIKISGGGYIVFVDSDDWLTRDSINILYTKLKNTDADLCCGNYYSVLVSGLKLNRFYSDTEFSLENFYELAAFAGGAFPAWATLFKRELIQNDFPTDVCLHEDTVFVYKYLLNCEKVATCSYGVYYYNHLSNTSLSRIYYADKCIFNSNPLELRCRLFRYCLPIRQKEIIVEIFIDTLIYYCQYLSLDQSQEKIIETYQNFEKYLSLITIDDLKDSGSHGVKKYLDLYEDIVSQNTENIYQYLSESQIKNGRVKSLIRRIILPILQFFVFKLQLGYKK